LGLVKFRWQVLPPTASPKWVFVVRALVTVKGTGAAKDELNKM
jgi:hypothetical protein